MIVMDMFVQIVLKGLWMGGQVITTACFAPFSTPIFPQSTEELTSALAQWLEIVLPSGAPGFIVTPWLNLGDASRLSLNLIEIYGKYAGGQTQVIKAAVDFAGTRVVGSEALPPQTTIRTYAPSLVYGEKGSTLGLPGVYEADNIDGRLSPSSAAVTAANGLIDHLNLPYDVAITNDYVFEACTVKRIQYNTLQGKLASRMPFEPGDVPSCYKLGDRAVSLVQGTNNHRKIGFGS